MTKKDKLKILAASDIEGDSALSKELARKAEKNKVDLVVLCGDLTGWEDSKDIIKPFKDKNQTVLLLPGNHDHFEDIDFISKLYKSKNLHGYSAVYKNVGLFGAGGAQDLPLFPGNLSNKEMSQTLERAHKDLEKKKGIEKTIMVTHMHPKGSVSEFSGVPGSKSIKSAAKKFHPDLLIHGHIHEAEGMEDSIGSTKVINVGRKGKIIEI